MHDLTVLVVDDETDFVETLLKRLARKGVDCAGAGSGAQALEQIRVREFDVVLLDMNMADKNGNEVLKEIKKISPDTQVIILTGYASASAGREGLLGGASDYLIKPVEFETLYERLKDAAREGSAAARDRAPENCQPNTEEKV